MRTLILILACLLWGFGAAPVQAEPITLSGNGTVLDAQPGYSPYWVGSGAPYGTPFSFSLSFDWDQSTNSFGMGDLTVTVGTNTLAFRSPVYAAYENGSSLDQVWITLYEEPITIGLFGADYLGNWLTADAWPRDFAGMFNRAAGNYPGNRFLVEFYGEVIFQGKPLAITQVPAVAPVPEPSTLLLIATGLVAGVRHRRRVSAAPY